MPNYALLTIIYCIRFISTNYKYDNVIYDTCSEVIHGFNYSGFIARAQILLKADFFLHTYPIKFICIRARRISLLLVNLFLLAGGIYNVAGGIYNIAGSI
jgi:hypothetical protein